MVVTMFEAYNVSVVIPCYKVKNHIIDVIESIPDFVSQIYVVDDCCPDKSSALVENIFSNNSRVSIIQHAVNLGVGGAMVTGYKRAIDEGADIIVKIDGDGQMDAGDIERFIQPIVDGNADYTKGNRFFDIEDLSEMPLIRLFGNAALSFINKVSSGYWDLMDPTNGYTAIHRVALMHLPLEKIENRYFFESDMLFRLGTVRAVVCDIPMVAKYDEEESNLRVSKVLVDFPLKYLSRFFKRIFYSYFLRDFNAGTVFITVGMASLIAGTGFGINQWMLSSQSGIPATSGSVMLAALPILLGVQLLISGFNFDISNVPKRPIQKLRSRLYRVLK